MILWNEALIALSRLHRYLLINLLNPSYAPILCIISNLDHLDLLWICIQLIDCGLDANWHPSVAMLIHLAVTLIVKLIILQLS